MSKEQETFELDPVLRRLATLEDFAQAEELGEIVLTLRALVEYNESTQEFCDAACEAVTRLVAKPQNAVTQPKPSGPEQVVEVAVPKAVRRSYNRYRLLKTVEELTWTTKPQILMTVRILQENFGVGVAVDEDDIVAAMIANEAALKTRQGGKRIWDYYKGVHMEGLMMHGVIEKA